MPRIRAGLPRPQAFRDDGGSKWPAWGT